MTQARFTGTESYVATPDLMMAVNAAVTLGRPLLIKGEPGTGKTQLAAEIAQALQRPLYEWHIKSTSKAHHGLYEYDAVSRLRDSQLGEAKVHDIRNYIMKGSLWEAFESSVQPVLLIDEIDKADIEFPNDLLRELDRMEFFVHETRELIKAAHRSVATPQGASAAAVSTALSRISGMVDRRLRQWMTASMIASSPGAMSIPAPP
jgi:MoxR-like ATPase